MNDQNRRWEVAVVLLLLVAGGVLGLVATSWVWGRADIGPAMTESTPTVTGRELLPSGRAVAFLALASASALLATRRTGRTLIGAILAFAGLAAAASSYRLALELPARAGPLWSAVAGLLIFAAGVFTVARARGWPEMSPRYQHTRLPPSSAERPTSQQTWDALDRGEDPTSGM